MNAICLPIDRLHTGYLGAYGNSWIETPAIDRLASQSFLFDQAWIDSPRPGDFRRACWHGGHAMCPQDVIPARSSLPALLGKAEISTVLLTDQPEVAKDPQAEDFEELVQLDPPWQAKTACRLEETHLAQCFVELLDWLGTARGPYLLWCDLAGFAAPWDAPEQLRRSYWESGDPEPIAAADVPDRRLRKGYDPDEVLAVTQAYCGQLSVLDTCLGALMESLDGSQAGHETLLILTSHRGFPLGEHGRIGACDEALYGELAHVPLMLRFPDSPSACGRSGAIVSPGDLWATLLDWWQVPDIPPSPVSSSLLPLIRGEADSLRDRWCLTGPGAQRAILTPAWYLRNAETTELFAKPDDRWEVNNVADRCHDIAESLQTVLQESEEAILSGSADKPQPLDEILLNGLG